MSQDIEYNMLEEELVQNSDENYTGDGKLGCEIDHHEGVEW